MPDSWADDDRTDPERATSHPRRFQRRILVWAGQVVVGSLFGAALGIALATSHTPSQLAFSSDGRTLVGSVNGYFWSEPNDPISSYGVIKVWDVATGETLSRIVGSASWLRSFAISPDGSTLALADDSPSIDLWDLGQGTRKGVLSGHTGNIRQVAFAPSGTILASSSHDGEVRIWDQATSRSRLTMHVDEYGAFGLMFAPDGNTLVTNDADNVQFWDASDGRLVKQVDGYPDSSHRGRYALGFLGFSEDGKNFLLARHEGRHGQRVAVLDGATGAEKFVIKPWSRLLVLSPDSRAIVVGDRSGNVSLLDATSGRTLLQPDGLRGEVRCVAFSSDGKLLAAGDDGGRVRVWETSTGKLRSSISADDPFRRWGLTAVVSLVWAAATIRQRLPRPHSET